MQLCAGQGRLGKFGHCRSFGEPNLFHKVARTLLEAAKRFINEAGA
jgi:hypothetical protein